MSDEIAVGYLLSLAEISGVFIGFGALIGAIQSREERDTRKMANVAGVCAIGIVTLLACLFPLLLFGLEFENLWFYSSLVFLAMIIIAFGLAYSNPAFTHHNPVRFKENLVVALVFWVLFEIPIQVGLLCNIFGFFPEHSAGLYFIAVIFNFAESGLFLILMVFDGN